MSHPTHHVVREDRDLEPRRVRPEHTRREMFETGSGLEVLDRQFNCGVFAMEPVDLGGECVVVELDAWEVGGSR